MEEKLSIIIPTKDRQQDLTCLLESINIQKIRPVQIIVVDAGDTSVEALLKKFTKLNIDYVRFLPASLPAQRNAGIRKVIDEATLVGFSDDDIVFGQESIKKMIDFWKDAPVDTAGVSFNLVNLPFQSPTFMEKLFLLNTGRIGMVLRSGFQCKTACVNETMRVQWLPGCAMVWKKFIFDKFWFDEWFYGYAHCEDLDFSYRIAKRYKLFILKDAKTIHNTKAIDKKYEYHLGIMQVVNRVYFVKKNPGFSLALCYWSCMGLFLKNVYLGTIGCKLQYLLRGFGILTGIFISFFKDARIKERIKL